MLLRSHETASPVLAGLAPGVTATVNKTVSPVRRVLGVAVPVPEGLVGTGALPNVWPVLNAPKVFGASLDQVKSSYVAPVPVSCNEFPTAPEPDSETPMLVLT